MTDFLQIGNVTFEVYIRPNNPGLLNPDRDAESTPWQTGALDGFYSMGKLRFPWLWIVVNLIVPSILFGLILTCIGFFCFIAIREWKT